ncbi:MAG: magnesium transporter [Chlamydiota bacterium]
MEKTDKEILVKDLMQLPPMVIDEQEIVENVLNALRKKECNGKILYFYVVDSENTLLGILPTRALLLAEPQERVQNIMQTSIFFLHDTTTYEKAMESLSHHRLLALPVVNAKKKLVGFFDIQMCLEENIDLFKEQRSQEIFQLLGMHLEISTYKHPVHAYTKRMPWILCNMIGGIACAIVSYIFQAVLIKVLLLAMFIPLVLALSESISMQSMTQSLQILKKQNISLKKVVSRVFFEIRVAILMSATSGILVGLLSFFWKATFMTSLTIAMGVTFSVILSAVLGASIPIALHSSKLDPKVASGPVVLAVADVMTTSIYLFLATYWLL